MNTRQLLLALAGSLAMQVAQGQDWNRLPGGNVINNTEWIGADFGSSIPLRIQTRADQPIDFSTSDRFRARINQRISYPVLNTFPNIPADGFTLITPDMGFLNQAPRGPFSRLHLAEGGQAGNAEQWGYRPWQRNGISFTGNGDQGYMGQKYSGDNKTDMVVQWSDNPGQWKGDRMRFIFTSGYNPGAPTGMNSLEGLEGMRLYPDEHDFINVGIGDFFAGGDDPTERLDVRTGRVRIRRLPTDPVSTSTEFVTVNTATGVLEHRPMSTLPDNCEWTFGGGPNGLNVNTAYGTGTTCPGDQNQVNIGGSIPPPGVKLYVEGNMANVNPVGLWTRSYSNTAATGSVTGMIGQADKFGANAGLYHYGLLGRAYNGTLVNCGVYGTASGGATNWAGYFAGDVNATGTGYFVNGAFVASDAQFKTNVEPLEDPLAIIMQLRPHRYNFLADQYPQMNFPSSTQVGLIAQELEPVVPALVKDTRVEAVTDTMGTEISPAVAYKAVNYSGLVPYLIGAVQQQQATIDHLQDQVNNCCATQGGMAPQGRMEQRMTPQGNDLQEQRLLIIPNPVADLTTLEYYVPQAGKVSLSISSSDGKPLGTLREELAEAGAYTYSWNTTKLSAGTYFCTFLLDGAVVVRQAVKVK